MKEIWAFLIKRKKFWLAPVIILLVIIGILLIIGGTSAIAPFIYSIF